ncbi:nuclease-related domain-containing protein [Sutcliffiella horikoshii]|uniref:nuclease-related domain-containing protein n=1 Tax=Sutcliffiella horikoshii TaxID=79883 RepID=UPI001F2B245C|nr:nuclease-related domain-containing protein [Sutcliffiella horikoshii]MCG1020878.1 NERD domain-containing protein [Sutcliffiella horikoshii]
MIVKKRDFPVNILFLKAIERRLKEDHPSIPRVKELIAKYTKGYKGETSIDYPLSILPDQDYLILHSISLQFQNQNFHIDSLLLSTNFILLLEVKNMSGTIHFDRSFNQLTQTYMGIEYYYQCPIIQVSNQERFLKQWIKQFDFPSIPLTSLVVISNPSSMIQVDPGDRTTFQKVIHSHFLPAKIEQQHTIFNRAILSPSETKNLASLIIKHHKVKPTITLRQLNIDSKELLFGVQCSNCLAIPMKRAHAFWRCDFCNFKSKDAHIPALRDYCLLFNESISNQEGREFLLVPSNNSMKRILTAMGLEVTGNTKNRRYNLYPLIIHTPPI